jgi:hypothetical protein
MTKYEKNTIICAAFCGTGKSYLCNNFSESYKEIEDWEYRNGDFPNNYIQDVIKMIGRTQYLFISTEPLILKELNKLNVDVKLIYPENKLRNEYLDRFIERDSPHDFIGAIMKYWNVWINELKEQNYCEHIILKSGQYLQDVI